MPKKYDDRVMVPVRITPAERDRLKKQAHRHCKSLQAYCYSLLFPKNTVASPQTPVRAPHEDDHVERHV